MNLEDVKPKTKKMKVGDTTIVIKSLNMDEMAVFFEAISKHGTIIAAKVVLAFGIVSPEELKKAPGIINAELGLKIATEILELTGITIKPAFNPSRRNNP